MTNAVEYEAFGAVGDGVADDLPAICAAHTHANEQALPVRSRPDATYHLGRRALTATIATDTDWSTSRFTVDDSQPVEDHKASLFEVVSLLPPEDLRIEQLVRDQRQLDVHPQQDCFVLVESDSQRVFIRRGLNQNNGVPQHDCFVLRSDGTIEADIDWDYAQITRVGARPIDQATLSVRGGVFTSFANQAHKPDGYDYWARNISISRSNTEIDGLTHYVVGETHVGCPYTGFLSVGLCASITLRNCWVTPHKIYSTVGAAGKPVNMGSYDINVKDVVDFRLLNCRMHQVTDRTRWGVIGTNFCKNILLEDCHLSRMDTHMGVSGTYTVRRSTLGHMGLNAIGRGTLTVEDSTLYGHSLISFRPDYGSTWEGDVEIRNSRWIPSCGDEARPHLIGARNDGMHDFGYPCSMPRQVTIDGVHVEDANTPADYDGLYLLADPDAGAETQLPEQRPFPYAPCERVMVRGLTTASGKQPKLSPNDQATTQVTWE